VCQNSHRSTRCECKPRKSFDILALYKSDYYYYYYKPMKYCSVTSHSAVNFLIRQYESQQRCGHMTSCETTVQYCLRCSRWLAESSALLRHQQPANAFLVLLVVCWKSAVRWYEPGTGTRQREQLIISEQQLCDGFIVC